MVTGHATVKEQNALVVENICGVVCLLRFNLREENGRC